MSDEQQETKTINVLVADDHRMFREGLCALLRDRNFNVVGEADDGDKAVRMVEQLNPDVVVMDVSMNDMHGSEATRLITTMFETKVVALSMHEEEEFVTEMLTAGASGYLLKDCAAEELAQAITVVMDGKRYLSPMVTGGLVDAIVRQKKAEAETSVLDDLTERQVEILRQLAEGRTSQEIADQFELSIKTVHAHRDRIMDKLKTRSIADLTKIAVREGLTSL